MRFDLMTDGQSFRTKKAPCCRDRKQGAMNDGEVGMSDELMDFDEERYDQLSAIASLADLACCVSCARVSICSQKR